MDATRECGKVPLLPRPCLIYKTQYHAIIPCMAKTLGKRPRAMYGRQMQMGHETVRFIANFVLGALVKS